MRFFKGLIVLLVAVASASCTQAEYRPEENRNRQPVMAGIVSIQHNNTFYGKPGNNVVGAYISQTNTGPSSDGSDAQSHTVIVSNGNQPTQVYMERNGEPVNTYQVPAGQPQPPAQQTFQPRMVPRAPKNQQFQVFQPAYNYTQQFVELNKRIDAILSAVTGNKAYLDHIVAVLENLQKGNGRG